MGHSHNRTTIYEGNYFIKKEGRHTYVVIFQLWGKKGSRDLDFSDMKKLRTYFKMGTFLDTFEQFSV